MNPETRWKLQMYDLWHLFATTMHSTVPVEHKISITGSHHGQGWE